MFSKKRELQKHSSVDRKLIVDKTENIDWPKKNKI